jgi:hypothetical protein
MIEEQVGLGVHNSKHTPVVSTGSFYCEAAMQCCCVAVMPARTTYSRTGGLTFLTSFVLSFKCSIIRMFFCSVCLVLK